MSPPRLLVINPNTNVAVTGWLAAEARRVAGDAFEVIAVNAESGLAALETPRDVETAARAVLDCIATHADVEAAILAAFGDPGLVAARALGRMPVVGLGEAGMKSAAADGRTFSIVALGAAMRGPILTRVAELGMSGRLAELRVLPFPIAELVANRYARFDEIAEAVKRCAGDAVLLAGAPFAGMADGVSRETGRVTLDGVAACVEEAGRRFGLARELR